MAELLVKGVQTENGTAQIDYNALANKPDGRIQTLENNLNTEITRAQNEERKLKEEYTVSNAAKLGGQLPSYYATSDHSHVVDSSMSSTSTNPVQNKIVNAAITEAKTAASNAQKTANKALPKSGGVITGDLTVGGNIVRTAACSARGTAETLNLENKETYKKITLDAWISRTDNAFEFNNGGIKCPYAGNIAVSGSVYFGDAVKIRGVYVTKADGTEIASTWGISTDIAGSATTGMSIVPVSAGDIIYLNARAHAESGELPCLPSNVGTSLNIMYV